MTPLEMIKEGILKENPQMICDAYFKLTGEKITKPEKKFDVQKASKQEIYNILKAKNNNLPPITEYSVKDLRELYTVYHGLVSTEKTVSLPTRQDDGVIMPKINDGGTFVFNERKLLVGDKKSVVNKLQPSTRDLKTIGEGEFVEKEYREPVQLVTITCDLCKAKADVLPVYVTAEKGGFCDNCREKTFRR